MGQAVDFRRLRTTISSVTFEIADRDLVITELIKSLQDASDASPSTKTPMLNQPITVLMGFTDIRESDFTTWVGNIDNYGWTGTGWSFSARDTQRFTQQKIFKSERTTLDGSINSSVTTIDLTDATNFSAGDYIRIDDEVILLGTKSVNQFTGCTRAQHSTTAVSHTDLTDVFERQVISGHPLDILEEDIWTTELGISSDLIDSDEIADIQDHWLVGWEFLFYLDDPDGVDAQKFTESDLFGPTGCFLRVKQDGVLSVGIIRVPFPDESTLTANESTLTNVRLGRIQRDMVNRLTLEYDYDEITGKYTSTTVFIDNTSVTQQGKTNEERLKFKGVRTALDAETILGKTAERLFRQFGSATPDLQATMSMKNRLQEVGDVVEITHSHIPDISSGTLGLTDEQMALAKIGVDFSSGNLSVTFSYTGLTKGDGDYRRIAPDTVVDDWPDASSTDQGKYIFVDHFDIAPG
jgi:hypothetical protein